MQVCICAERYKSDFWYQGYTLTLPTYQMALENAKQCARVADGEGYSLELVGQWPDFLYEPLEACSATLQELNFLAQKLSQMNQEEMDTYEGVIPVSYTHLKHRSVMRYHPLVICPIASVERF